MKMPALLPETGKSRDPIKLSPAYSETASLAALACVAIATVAMFIGFLLFGRRAKSPELLAKLTALAASQYSSECELQSMRPDACRR